jgi:hypothetical protein
MVQGLCQAQSYVLGACASQSAIFLLSALHFATLIMQSCNLASQKRLLAP